MFIFCSSEGSLPLLGCYFRPNKAGTNNQHPCSGGMGCTSCWREETSWAGHAVRWTWLQDAVGWQRRTEPGLPQHHHDSFPLQGSAAPCPSLVGRRKEDPASPLELVAAPLRGFRSHAAWQTGQRQICVQARRGIHYGGGPQDILDACSPQAFLLLRVLQHLWPPQDTSSGPSASDCPWEHECCGSSGVKHPAFECCSCRADVWWEQGDGKGTDRNRNKGPGR